MINFDRKSNSIEGYRATPKLGQLPLPMWVEDFDRSPPGLEVVVGVRVVAALECVVKEVSD